MAWRELINVKVIKGKTGDPGSPKIPTFTLATVPDATAWTGHQIVISDATPQCLAYSDGTNWIAADDGTTAA